MTNQDEGTEESVNEQKRLGRPSSTAIATIEGVASAGNTRSTTALDNALQWALRVVLSAALVLGVLALPGCYSSSGSASKSKADKSKEKTSVTEEYPVYDDELPSAPEVPDYDFEDERAYEPENPYWPTTAPELLAIPEEQRWYNARSQIGTNCTIAGPVAEVYQATQSQGMPIFVDIGEPYPSPNRVTLVVWADSLSNFEEMLNEVSQGDAWLSITGYLSSYRTFVHHLYSI